MELSAAVGYTTLFLLLGTNQRAPLLGHSGRPGGGWRGACQRGGAGSGDSKRLELEVRIEDLSEALYLGEELRKRRRLEAAVRLDALFHAGHRGELIGKGIHQVSGRDAVEWHTDDPFCVWGASCGPVLCLSLSAAPRQCESGDEAGQQRGPHARSLQSLTGSQHRALRAEAQ